MFVCQRLVVGGRDQGKGKKVLDFRKKQVNRGGAGMEMGRKRWLNPMSGEKRPKVLRESVHNIEKRENRVGSK